ncbi:hypothetical protein EYC80_003452 [Monilinia laxa]|uniref:Uncharacterized protein n=1 Tax=Monilinia laxa TaxID=61186 RepID=A0A5N6KE20_MONLA|nr:hypothetical protein EYC80_003452 [Monilinia laxa]
MHRYFIPCLFPVPNPIKTNSKNNRHGKIRKIINKFINITHTSHTVIISRHLHFHHKEKRKIKNFSQSASGV